VPTYGYRCANGHSFEVVQRMSDDPLTTCEQCDAPVERVFHPVAVHFKGSGFYSTDYGSKKKAKAESEAKSESKKDTKSEAKPDTGKSGSSKEAGKDKAAKGESG
jgi:putative FmdB family regulatory protein